MPDQGQDLVLTYGSPNVMPNFPALLETLLWTPQDGYAWGDRHLQRLMRSAKDLGYAIDPESVQLALMRASDEFDAKAQRVRLVVDAIGRATVTAQPLMPLPCPYRVRLAIAPIDSACPQLRYKTTQRHVYEQAIAQTSDCEDVLLWNERGEVTESCIGNLLVEVGHRRFTPALTCGLLPGIYREVLLETEALQEAVITVEELSAASGLWLMNSVRGLWPIQLQLS
ncbi:aminotransferase class IV [Leptolyngbya sp. AN02str]|uniref:aminotransferase class IV n=1 Tax=Leptolyngbya sp. AN02str TaxID=3423363 RepID=UPI003D3234E8